MSDTWLLLIPTECEFVPAPTAQEQATAILKGLSPGFDIRSVVTEEIEFVDAGGNWDGVVCPSCGSDAEAWFSDAMNRSYEQSHFRDRSVVTPCCEARILLDALKFGWPVGFARFILEITNQAVASSAGLLSQQLEILEKTLGCSLRTIFRHY